MMLDNVARQVARHAAAYGGPGGSQYPASGGNGSRFDRKGWVESSQSSAVSTAVASQDVKLRILEMAYAKSARVAQLKQIQDLDDPQKRGQVGHSFTIP